MRGKERRVKRRGRKRRRNRGGKLIEKEKWRLMEKWWKQKKGFG